MTPQEAKAELLKIVEHYQQCKKNCLENYIYIASDLYNIKNWNYVAYIRREDGSEYNSVYDLIEDYFAISKSTAINYIGVFNRFADKVSMQIKPQFKDYSFTQLCEMLPLNDSQIANCDSTMTCEAIREFKKKDKGKVKEDTFVPDPNTSIQLALTKELYGKVLNRAKSRKIHVKELVVEILNLYFETESK